MKLLNEQKKGAYIIALKTNEGFQYIGTAGDVQQEAAVSSFYYSKDEVEAAYAKLESKYPSGSLSIKNVVML